MVVLLNPAATVKVSGITLKNGAPANGRATVARGDRPGCAYGTKVRIEARDSRGRILLFPGSKRYYTVTDGCQRTEF